MKKVLLILLAFAMFICTLASCGGNTNNTNETEANDETKEASTSVETEPSFSYEKSDLLPTLDYKNEDFNVFNWNTQTAPDWIDSEDKATNAVEKAIYEQRVNVEERLKITFNVTTVPGRYADMASFLTTLEEYENGGLSPDLVGQYSLCSASGMLKGLYTNILDGSYLDWEAPWWNDSLRNANTINNKLYYISGDLTPSLIYNMYCVVFNKSLLDNYHIDYPYEMVENDTWTIENMLDLIVDTAVNPSGNGTWDPNAGSIYGFDLPKLSVDAFQLGSGLPAITKKDNGTWAINKDFSGSRATDVVDKLLEIAYDNEDVFYDKDSTYQNQIFANNGALFTTVTLNYVEKYIRDNQLKCGVLPIPMFDSAQDDYYTTFGMTVTYYSIPTGLTVDNVNRTSAVLEAMGSNAYRELVPVIFEKTFATRYAETEADSKMFKLIRDSIYFDPANVVNDMSTFSAFRNCVYNHNNWPTFFQTKISAITATMKKINNLGVEN